jgi:hypothetical protein
MPNSGAKRLMEKVRTPNLNTDTEFILGGIKPESFQSGSYIIKTVSSGQVTDKRKVQEGRTKMSALPKHSHKKVSAQDK